jgi:dUTP pyrophosphatase
MPEVLLQRLHPAAVVPQRMTDAAAGYDLHACLEHELRLVPGARIRVPTGWALAIPMGFEGQVRPRSGLAFRHGVTVLNAPGTIDADYRGELAVVLVNLGQEPFVIAHGDRVAQLVVAPVAPAQWVEVRQLPASHRGEGGFGSTGNK